jgi:DNA repair photolyase
MKKTIQERTPKQWLTKASGYLTGYSHTLNPYVGCVFGCRYCYVQKLPVALFHGGTWGEWVDIKKSNQEAFRKELIKAKKKGPVTIFMSSSTDPYQPLEHKQNITRSLLEVMTEEAPDFLLVQTRSPLVTRDIDLLKKLKDRVRVSMTIETDQEGVRKVLTPAAPPIPRRLKAIDVLRDSGLDVQAAVSPVLPYTKNFPGTLREKVDRIVIDDFFMGDGSGGKRSRQLGMDSELESLGYGDWFDKTTIDDVLQDFRQFFSKDQLFLSQEGFLP